MFFVAWWWALPNVWCPHQVNYLISIFWLRGFNTLWFHINLQNVLTYSTWGIGIWFWDACLSHLAPLFTIQQCRNLSHVTSSSKFLLILSNFEVGWPETFCLSNSNATVSHWNFLTKQGQIIYACFGRSKLVEICTFIFSCTNIRSTFNIVWWSNTRVCNTQIY